MRHVRELLRGPSGNLSDAYAGLNGASLSFATALLGGTDLLYVSSICVICRFFLCPR